ncbi:MAG TPA: DNA-processing protein DprA [Bacteroidia bacterium]|nr:DNA-processing protein DprA [Bacteroidia bacterium]
MAFDERVFQVALSMIPGIGPVTSKKLITRFGSAPAVFRAKKNEWRDVPFAGKHLAAMVKDKSVLLRAEKEIAFAEKNNIRLIFFSDKEYPYRLKQCFDGPYLIYYRGNAPLNPARVVSIVGTRRASEYGRMLTEKLVEDLSACSVTVVSGLAFGIDILAHKASLKYGAPTIGVLGHGLDMLYPVGHKATAKKMEENGGILSDFPSETIPDKENFPLRNRIVAGMSDATIVVQSGASGGSMITAEFANNYNRDVFAFPGAVGDALSAGCHSLIRQNKAALIESADDVLKFMGWERKEEKPKQSLMHIGTTPEQETLLTLLRGQGNVHIDDLVLASGFSQGKTSSILLELEFAGAVKSLPGKFYRLN